MLSKIYTKKGDRGKSSLPGGPLITKSSPVFSVLGQIDLVNAQIGLLLTEEIAQYGQHQLLNIQKKLMSLGSVVAGVDKSDIKDLITEKDIKKLEEEIDAMTGEMQELRNFILPGGSRRSAQAHIIRAEVRTLERRLTALKLENEIIIAWVNRLSDFFFTLARYFNYLDEIDDIIW